MEDHAKGMFWSAITQTPLNSRTNQNAAVDVKDDEKIEENVLSQVGDEDDDD